MIKQRSVQLPHIGIVVKIGGAGCLETKLSSCRVPAVLSASPWFYWND